MNEITLMEALSTLSNYWLISIPFIMVGAAFLGGILSAIINGVCRYVNRSEETIIDFPMFLARLMYEEVGEQRDSDGDIRVKPSSARVWWFMPDMKYLKGIDFTIGFFLSGLVWFGLCGVLHVLPAFVLVTVASIFGTLWTARLATDGIKKASSVMNALEAHKKSPDAHRSHR